MKARTSPQRTRESQTAARLDAMPARSAGEVLGVLSASTRMPTAPAGVPTGLWKTGWLAQSPAPAESAA